MNLSFLVITPMKMKIKTSDTFWTYRSLYPKSLNGGSWGSKNNGYLMHLWEDVCVSDKNYFLVFLEYLPLFLCKLCMETMLEEPFLGCPNCSNKTRCTTEHKNYFQIHNYWGYWVIYILITGWRCVSQIAVLKKCL